MENTNDSNDYTITRTGVATYGDVNLVVILYQKDIRVCPSVSNNASKVFKVMFGPHFAEGQNLDSHDPKDVLMSDDNAKALEVIYNIMHVRKDAVPHSFSPKDIFEIATAADKFDCVVALRYGSAIWLSPKGVEDILKLGCLMAVSYILDDAQASGDITVSRMLHHQGSYLALANQVIGLADWVPWKVFYLLEERRNRMRTELQHILFNGSTDAGMDESISCTCAWGAVHSLAHTKLLQYEDLRPLQVLYVTVSKIVEKMDQMRDSLMPKQWELCDYR
ncbi:unnamed protein product [Alternaria alternata]